MAHAISKEIIMLKKSILTVSLLLGSACIPAMSISDNDIVRLLFNDKEVTCLTQTIYYESRGEPLTGQKAVALVTINRTFDERFPSSICANISKKGQYSWYGKGIKVHNREAWSKAKNVAYKVINNYDTLKEFDALYFHAVSVQPRWKLKKIAKIGNHIFYK